MHKEIKISKTYLNFGFSFRAFTLGINITKCSLMIDLAFVWIGIEW
jgi:hypothetical protein